MIRSFLLALILTLPLSPSLAPPAAAHEVKAGELTIVHPFARATAARNGGAYMTIANAGGAPDRLLRARTAAAAKVELHTIVQQGDVMQMRAVDAIDIPANGKAELKPGGFHVMLLGLGSALVEGQTFPLVLEFEKAGAVEVTVNVEKAGASQGAGHGGHQHPPAKAP